MGNGEWVWVLVYNTHVGQMLRSGAVRWLLGQRRYDLVLLQEVQSPAARAWLRLVFNPAVWSAVGTWPPSWGRGASGTIILARRSTLRKESSDNPIVSKYRDKWHPERRATRGRYVDRRTGAKLDIGSVHTWIGGDRDADLARQAQRDSHGATAGTSKRRGWNVLRAGDWNESVGGRPSVAARVMGNAGLHLVGDQEPRIDAAFVSAGKVRNFHRIPVPSRFKAEPQHPALAFAWVPNRTGER